MNKIEWVGTFSLVIAGIWIAGKFPCFEYSYVLFAVGHIIWVSVALKIKKPALVFSNLFFLLVDVLGIFSWLFSK